jgi:hypothetical protein
MHFKIPQQFGGFFVMKTRLVKPKSAPFFGLSTLLLILIAGDFFLLCNAKKSV